MSRKISQSKKKSSAKKSGFPIELTRKQFFLWFGLAFLAMAWMFTLGIIVGRGFSPVRFDMQKLKKELIALKQEALKRDQARFKIERDNLTGAPRLDFYKALTDKKEEARSKLAKAREQTVKPNTGSPEASKTGKIGRRGLLTIQVASLKNAEWAKRIITRLKGKGYDAYEVTANVPGKGICHRVRVGHFADSIEAGRVAARLKQDKFEAMIVRE